MRTVAIALILTACLAWATGGIASAVHALPEGSQEYTISIKSPNISLVNNNLFVCVGADVPMEDVSYIVGISPKPVPSTYFHITVLACDEPGFRDPETGKPGIWDCGTSETYERFVGLPNAEQCNNPASPHGVFKYQFQGGLANETSLKLPDGTGIPVGGKTGRKTIVFAFHFPKMSQTLDNTTAGTEVDVTLVKGRPGMKTASTILMGGFGFLGANSISNISASWTVEEDITVHPTNIYTHSHSLAIGMKVFIQRKDGERELIHEKDARKHKGTTPVIPEPEPMMRGDKLVLECEYNNTQSKNVRVWNAEMCYVILFYYVDGEKTLDTQLVYSVDPVYKDCFPGLEGIASYSKNEKANYDGLNSFHGATRDECLAPLVLHSDASVDSVHADGV